MGTGGYSVVDWGRFGIYMLLAGGGCGRVGIAPVWGGVVRTEVDTGRVTSSDVLFPWMTK